MFNSPYDLMRSMTNYLKTAGVISKAQATDIHHQIDGDERAYNQLEAQQWADHQRRMDDRSWWRKLLGMGPGM